MQENLNSHSQVSFGTRLQTLRREYKLTQIDLSEHAQLSKSYISFLESGIRHPSRDVVLRLSETICPQNTAIRDELLILAGFTPIDMPVTVSIQSPPYLPDDFKSFLSYVLHLIRQKEFEQAENQIQQGFTRFKLTAQMQTLLAHLELARGSFEQAVLFQNTAIQHYHLSPSEHDKGLSLVDFILNLGVMYFLWADQALFAATGQSAKQSALLRQQAQLRYQQALETYQRGLELDDHHLYLLDEIGRVHINLADLMNVQEARTHWRQAIIALRKVLAHPNKHELNSPTLRETAAFLALAYAKNQEFEAAFLVLDTLNIDKHRQWSVFYIYACCACLAFEHNQQTEWLTSALIALSKAFEYDQTATEEQLKSDIERDLKALKQYQAKELEKVIPSKS